MGLVGLIFADIFAARIGGRFATDMRMLFLFFDGFHIVILCISDMEGKVVHVMGCKFACLQVGRVHFEKMAI